MILNREQIDAHFTLRRAMDDDFRNGTYRTDWTSIHALINGTDALIATARAYHDLRDAVLDPETVEAMYAVLGEFDPPSYNDLLGRELATITHAAVVARVERGEN